MMDPRVLCLWAAAFMGCATGGAAGAGGAQSGAQSEPGALEDEKVLKIKVGECTKTSLPEDYLAVRSSVAGWEYVVPSDSQITCEDEVAVFSVAGGSIVITLTSVVPLGNRLTAADIGRMMVDSTSQKLIERFGNGDTSHVQEGKYGGAKYPGLCTEVRYQVEGEPRVSQVCTGWSTDDENVVHNIMMIATDTPEAFKEADLDPATMFGIVLQNWTPSPTE